ncbi:MAG: hypothetical protein CMO98_07190 [Woeseia sp.]|nr:hypothetical protein [Woeseia sp.]
MKIPISTMQLPLLMVCTYMFQHAVAEDSISIASEILSQIEAHKSDWNSGDMQGYLDNYTQDETLSVLMTGGMLIGANTVNELYRGIWGQSKTDMGNFNTSDMTIRVLTPEIAIIRGLFKHVFEHEIVTGNFSQVWQKLGDDNWKIVHEHTARQDVFPTG